METQNTGGQRMELIVRAPCRDCRKLIVIDSYNLNYMYGKPTVCRKCIEDRLRAAFEGSK
jgi:hypothetical protein